MKVSFLINGKLHEVNSNTAIDTSLNTFIRSHAKLVGTKFMCLEGGCGVCIVTIKGRHPATKEYKTWAANSCLLPIFSCHGLEIYTIESLGNYKDGYHPIQSRLAHFNGTQCGYCSPGMIMNMYSLLEQSNNSLSMADIENAFGSNICRCTGYRSILDSFKTFAYDGDSKLKEICSDIEDFSLINKCKKIKCSTKCNKNIIDFSESNIALNFDDGKSIWHKIFKLNDIFDIFKKIGSDEYILIAGNTAHGVYRRNRSIKIFIDITSVPELRSYQMDTDKFVIGANVTLTDAIDLFKQISNINGFEYCQELAKHIDLVANVPVRNTGTLAGNLSIKRLHHEFPSDIFLLLETIGAHLTILKSMENRDQITVEEFLSYDMNQKVILNIIIPKLDSTRYKFKSYKIMPRAQNAHAYVNAAFLLEFNNIINDQIYSARICYGGINPKFIHAKNTEKLLIGLNIYKNENLQEILKSLSNELQPDWILSDASIEFRKQLAIALFYKFILATISVNDIRIEYRSGGQNLLRNISSGQQAFHTNEKNWPLTQAVQKLEASVQCSGEAEYVNDIPSQPDELWAAFVMATRVQYLVGSIDARDALTLDGVHAFYSAKDIPGKNNFSVPLLMSDDVEEIFVGINSKVLYYGQPIGVIIAESYNLANYAATLVKVLYVNDKENSHHYPLTTIDDILKQNAISRLNKGNSEFNMTRTKCGTDMNTVTIVGTFEIGEQFHFSMEPQTTLCIPKEGGEIDVYSSTQWIDHTQIAIAQCLNLSENKINMNVRRLGGGYGAKISRASLIATACAIASHLSNRTIRFVMSIESNMTIIGKRLACTSDYEVTVNTNGKIQKLKNNSIEGFGCNMNESPFYFTKEGFMNSYINDSWNFTLMAALTDAPSNTWCRAPGSLEGIAMIENIMEHIACVTGKDPIDVRQENISNDSEMKEFLSQFIDKCEYRNRCKEINKFNEMNRWRKRGIAICPMKFGIIYLGAIPTFIAIYHGDGSVVISHGGIECGQGINTKVAQVTAYKLGIPLGKVTVKSTNSVIAANAYVTGASITSETVCFAAIKACEILLQRMKPIREKLTDPQWNIIVEECYKQQIDLTAKYLCKASDLNAYPVLGCSCAEIEIDILTGNVQILRVDIVEDTGESISPNVDVGQIEGAFIMGIGYWLTEQIIYNRENGELLTNRTWNYKPPGAKDIPIDFRITLHQSKNNNIGVLRSKAVGEPAICMSIVVLFAIRYALNSSRKDAGLSENWYQLGAPTTPEHIFLNSGNSIKLFQI